MIRARHRRLGLSVFAVFGILILVLGLASSAGPLNRTIAFYNIHTKETLEVTYRRQGKLVPAAVKKINWILRDWRQNQSTKMDTQLIDLLWSMHRELGSQEPIHIISGYRSPKTNAILRKTRGGQAKKSRHLTGQAADVHFPDIPLRQLRYSALVREQGGVGYYPTSAIPFVHVDTGRVRAWPRLPRHELALLFPSGQTRHLPRSGPPISRTDVSEARRNQTWLAQKVAAFHRLRNGERPETMVASLSPIPPWSTREIPKLKAPPKLVGRPSPPPQKNTLLPEASPAMPAARQAPQQVHQGQSPTRADKDKLAALVALANRQPRSATARPEQPETAQRLSALKTLSGPKNPAPIPEDRFQFAASWIAAPEYDDEHPGELSYRPFQIRPYLTETPDMNSPAFSQFVYRASGRVYALLDHDDDIPALNFRPGRSSAEQIVNLEASGRSATLASLPGSPPPEGVTRRQIQNTTRLGLQTGALQVSE